MILKLKFVHKSVCWNQHLRDTFNMYLFKICGFWYTFFMVSVFVMSFISTMQIYILFYKMVPLQHYITNLLLSFMTKPYLHSYAWKLVKAI